jgi:hypothetical protein
MSTYGLCFSTEIGISPIPLQNVIIEAKSKPVYLTFFPYLM